MKIFSIAIVKEITSVYGLILRIGLNLDEIATPLPSDKPYSLCSLRYKSDAPKTGTFPASNCATTELVPKLSFE